MRLYHEKHVDQRYLEDPWIAIVDKKTGKSLIGKNKYGVSVSKIGWNYKNETFYKVAGRFGFYIYDYTYDFTVSFPPSYKRLCIGAGGSVNNKMSYADKAFVNGKLPFWKTKRFYSKKKPQIAHFVNPKVN